MTEGFNPHGTTILGVRRDGVVAIGGDGQVTLGNTVMKGNARKVRLLGQGKVIGGFAGGTADAFTLFERFEGNRGLHAKVRWRMQHFYLDPAVDPLMPGSTRTADGKMKPGRWQNAATQTTWVQDTFFKWKSRMMENPFRIEGRAMVDTIPNKAKANNAEALLVQGFEFIRERTGIDIQANLVDAKGYKAAGVLHWRIDESAYKANMPDYEETDDTETDAERYTEDEYAEESGRKKAKKDRETEDSLKDRIARYKAECCFPGCL